MHECPAQEPIEWECSVTALNENNQGDLIEARIAKARGDGCLAVPHFVGDMLCACSGTRASGASRTTSQSATAASDGKSGNRGQLQ